MNAKIILLEVAKWVALIILAVVTIGAFVIANNTNWVLGLVSVPVVLVFAFVGLSVILSAYHSVEFGE